MMLDPETRDEIERAILATCFITPVDELPPIDPSVLSPKARRIHKYLLAGLGADRVADSTLVASAIRASANGSVEDDLLYMVDIFNCRMRGVNIGLYTRKLADDARLREAAQASMAAAEAIRQGDSTARVNEHLEAAQTALRASSELDSDRPLDIAAILAAESVPEVPWAIHGLFARQDLVLVGGEGGTGKSVLALDMAIALATGQQFLGLEIPEPQPVLYLDEENQEHVVRRRIAQHMAGREIHTPPTGFSYYHQRGYSLRDLEGQARIANLIDRHEPQWVFLDSLIRFVVEGTNQDAAEFAAALKAERTRSGVGWVYLHHLGKPSKERTDAIHRLRGASDYVNASDALLTLEGDRDSDQRTLTPQQRRTSVLPAMLIRWLEAENEQSAKLVCTGSEASNSVDIVSRALAVAHPHGCLRQELISLLDNEGYENPQKAASRAIARLVAEGRAFTQKEGREIRVHQADSGHTLDTILDNSQ